MDSSLPGPSVHEIFQARTLEWVAISTPGDLPDPGIEHSSPELEGRFFTIEPPGKPEYGGAKKIQENRDRGRDGNDVSASQATLRISGNTRSYQCERDSLLEPSQRPGPVDTHFRLLASGTME